MTCNRLRSPGLERTPVEVVNLASTKTQVRLITGRNGAYGQKPVILTFVRSVLLSSSLLPKVLCTKVLNGILL